MAMIVIAMFVCLPISVLVLDEIDQLESKDQEILYTMFEWPHLTRSRLVLIGEWTLVKAILPMCQHSMLWYCPVTGQCFLIYDPLRV